jgi:hypothetical protein
MGPVEMTPGQLADVLEDMARTVRAADSFDGNLVYEAWQKTGPGYLVQGVYRVGNREGGQGGMRVIGDMSVEAGRLSTQAGRSCVHPSDHICIECASDEELAVSIPPFDNTDRGM